MNKDNKSACAGFVILCQNHVLLVCTPNGNWGYPKGKRNTGETLEVCAYRELKEETNLSKDQIKIVNGRTLYEITDKGNVCVTLYLATCDKLIEPSFEDPDELGKVKWVKISDAYKLLKRKNRKQILQSAVKFV